MILAAAGTFDPQGPAAETMADLWWLMLVIGTVVFVIVGTLLVGGLLRRDGDEAPPQGRYDWWIMGGGVILPIVILAVVYGATLASMRATADEAPDDALTVEIVGHQWWWEVRYPDFTTANELHIPVGRPVALELTSADVIHSFWVPSLGGKLDLLPDGVNTLVLEANEAGTHHTKCAEFCGLQHAEMGLNVVAEPEADLTDWMARQQEDAAEPTGEAARGRQIFLGSECATCHTIRGTAADGDVGPDLTHFAGRERLGAGVAANTSGRVTEWVSDPHTLKEGVDMPASELSDEDVAAVVAYLETLR